MNNNISDVIRPDLLGGTYLYSDSGSANSVFTFVVSLTMEADPDTMERAVREMLGRFPQFSVCADRSGEEYVFRHMEVPSVILPYSGRKEAAMSGDGFGDGPLFRIFYRYKTLYFDFHRAVTDERGASSFVQSVIFRYLQISGYDVENNGCILTADSSFHPAEAADAFVRLDDIPASRPVWYMDAKAARLGNGCAGGAFRVVRVHIPLSSLKGDTKTYGGMSETLLAPFFSHVLSTAFPQLISQGEYIVSYIQVNLAQYFPTPSLKPFFVNVPLAYNRKITEYPVGTVLMSQKKLLEAQLKTDALAYNAQCKISALDRIESMSGKAARAAGASELFRKKSSSATYSFCNVGPVIMPETMQRYITEYYTVVPPVLFPFTLSSVTYKGETVVTVASSENADGICRNFVSLLRNNDIDAYISEEYGFEPLKYKP